MQIQQHYDKIYQTRMINKTIDERYSKKKKSKQFENSWSITYRKPNYDALGDPHASYYFLNKSMRKHLTSLRKSIDKQGSFVERKQVRKMIGERIKEFDNDHDKRATKVQAYYYKMKSSPSISSLGSIKSRRSLLNEQKKQRVQKNQDQEPKKGKVIKIKNEELVKQKSKTLQPPMQRPPKQHELPKINNSKQIKQSQKLLEAQLTIKQEKNLLILNRTQHNKFLKFILERKKKLSVSQPVKKQQPQSERKQEEKTLQ